MEKLVKVEEEGEGRSQAARAEDEGGENEGMAAQWEKGAVGLIRSTEGWIWLNKWEMWVWQRQQGWNGDCPGRQKTWWKKRKGQLSSAACYSRCHLFQSLLISAWTYLLGRKLNIDLFFSLRSNTHPLFFFDRKDHYWWNLKFWSGGLVRWELCWGAFKKKNLPSGPLVWGFYGSVQGLNAAAPSFSHTLSKKKDHIGVRQYHSLSQLRVKTAIRNDRKTEMFLLPLGFIKSTLLLLAPGWWHQNNNPSLTWKFCCLIHHFALLSPNVHWPSVQIWRWDWK